MIALDTNVLIRFLTNDDKHQAEVARMLLSDLSADNPGFISREVTLELTWVLNRAYGYSSDKIANVLEYLIATRGIKFETDDDIFDAIYRFRKRGVEFADLMIVAAAKRQGAQPLYTFDEKLAKIDGVELLA